MYEKTLNQPLNVPNNSSPTARNILNQMLNKNCAKRLGAIADFDEVKDHPFFESIDWDKLLKCEIRAPFVPKIYYETDNYNISKEFNKIDPSASKLLLLLKKKKYFSITSLSNKHLS